MDCNVSERTTRQKGKNYGLTDLLAENFKTRKRAITIEEKSKILIDHIAAQRKFLAQQRSYAIRNRPPTKIQLRNHMMTILEAEESKEEVQEEKKEEESKRKRKLGTRKKMKSRKRRFIQNTSEDD
ncbi:hypothetical protein Tco_0268991 [Tanacetum coccineum]